MKLTHGEWIDRVYEKTCLFLKYPTQKSTESFIKGTWDCPPENGGCNCPFDGESGCHMMEMRDNHDVGDIWPIFSDNKTMVNALVVALEIKALVETWRNNK
jgi:hypothetical protein